MIILSIRTNTGSKQATVEPTDVLSEVLEEQGVNTTSTAIHINGSLVTVDELNSTFEDLDVEDDTTAIVSAIVKADSAQ